MPRKRKPKAPAAPKAEPIRICYDREIDDFDRMRMAALAVDENPANAPRADLAEKAMVSPLGIAFLTNSLWKPGRLLKVFFMGGTASQRAKAKAAAGEIERAANLRFEWVNTAAESDLRISFDSGSGAWSYIGVDSLGIPKSQATMNLGFDQGGTYVHEFLHAVGAVHEHQHPEAGILWNEPAVYQSYSGSPNYWDRSTIKHNVIDRYSKTQTRYSSFDPLSVMLYPIDSRLTLNGFSSQWNTAMSTTDKEWLAKMYPAADAPPTGSLGGRVWVELSKDGKGFNINYEGRQASVRLLDGGKVEGTWS